MATITVTELSQQDGADRLSALLDEEMQLHVRFWHWFYYQTDDTAQVQIDDGLPVRVRVFPGLHRGHRSPG